MYLVDDVWVGVWVFEVWSICVARICKCGPAHLSSCLPVCLHDDNNNHLHPFPFFPFHPLPLHALAPTAQSQNLTVPAKSPVTTLLDSFGCQAVAMTGPSLA